MIHIVNSFCPFKIDNKYEHAEHSLFEVGSPSHCFHFDVKYWSLPLSMWQGIGPYFGAFFIAETLFRIINLLLFLINCDLELWCKMLSLPLSMWQDIGAEV